MFRIENTIRNLAAIAALLIGVALPSTPAVAQVWQAGADYSNVQGYRNWRYMTYLPGSAGAPGIYELMAYGPNYYGFDSWHTVPYNGDYIAGGIMHPSGLEAARVWESPIAGTVRITGRVAKWDSTASGSGLVGDGVYVTIWKNGTALFDASIADDDHVGYSYDLTVDVQPGDWLIFRVNRIDNQYYDSTLFDPMIAVESLDSPDPGSWIEAVLRDGSSYVDGLGLHLFEGTTDPARRSRRLSLSHGLTVAANLIAKGNITAAIAELSTASGRLDSDPSPPDSMLDGPEKQALYADVQQLIYLLGLP